MSKKSTKKVSKKTQREVFGKVRDRFVLGKLSVQVYKPDVFDCMSIIELRHIDYPDTIFLKSSTALKLFFELIKLDAISDSEAQWDQLED